MRIKIQAIGTILYILLALWFSYYTVAVQERDIVYASASAIFILFAVVMIFSTIDLIKFAKEDATYLETLGDKND